ncbi:TENX-like protein [Mya arenaria]|uniref:TENX-like protein n=1 Tax=Mya arenaria TaxID=6604 RepID=A0ABY7FC04_MYAAR|nr:TENX-like protein [Mya arenaria]
MEFTTCSANCLDSRCEKSYGFCTDGCLDGFTGATCSDKCDVICKTCSQTNYSHCTSCFGGLSGPSCKCIPNCQCELNSQCLQGCNERYWGQNYNHSCHPSCTSCLQENGTCTQCVNNSLISFGDYCAIQCSETCVNKLCDDTTGRCLQGCVRNFYADKCDLVCPSTCASEPNKTRCDNYGRCLHGCTEGYKGITCASATSTPKSDASVGRLIGGTVGEAITIVSVIKKRTINN